MRRFRKSNIFKFFLISAVILLILNIPLSTKQGVDFKVYKLKIPLYIKLTEFIDRDHHYKRLIKDIVGNCRDDDKKVLLIFKWTHENIKTDIPQGWPIYDDHVWNIIVRGYGVLEQPADVFTTLCVYAGFDARMVELEHSPGRTLFVAAIKLKQGWSIFDPYHNFYFKKPSGEIATINDILSDRSLMEKQYPSILYYDIKYSEYFKDILSIDFDKMSRPRAYRQNFFRRIIYEIKALLIRLIK